MEELKFLLEEKYHKYNNLDFIETDPLQIPHSFSQREDIEIAGFLAAAIAWGNRKMIIGNAQKMMQIMENRPYEFVMEYNSDIAADMPPFVHRTFQNVDFHYFVKSLQNIYRNHGGLKNIFESLFEKYRNVKDTLIEFRKIFFELEYPQRTEKHIADVSKGAAAKRLNMFLMWMCRKDKSGVHFGIWNISPSALMLPLDTHTAATGRSLGLITRKQNDWKTVEEITSALRQFDPNDPVKYDFALFGMGINEKNVDIVI